MHLQRHHALDATLRPSAPTGALGWRPCHSHPAGVERSTTPTACHTLAAAHMEAVDRIRRSMQCCAASSDASSGTNVAPPALSSMRQPIRPRQPARTDDYSGTGLSGRQLSSIRKQSVDKGEGSEWKEGALVELTPEELASMDNVDATEMVSALSYIARTRQTPNPQQLLPMLEAAAPQLPTLSTQQLAETVRCLGAVGMRELPSAFCDALLQQLRPQLMQATASQLAHVSWGMARWPVSPGGHFPGAQPDENWMILYMDAIERCLSADKQQGDEGGSKQQQATPQQLASMLLLPVRCGAAPSEAWLAVVEEAATRCLRRSSVQDVSSIMYSLARLGLRPDPQTSGWLASCVDLILDELLLLDAQQLAEVAAALCALKVAMPRHALQQLRTAAQAALDPDSGPGSTIGAVALPPQVVEAARQVLQSQLAQLEASAATLAAT